VIDCVWDTLVCTISDNPEPFEIQLLCSGALAYLTLDTTTLQFDRVLVHRLAVIYLNSLNWLTLYLFFVKALTNVTIQYNINSLFHGNEMVYRRRND